MNKMRILTITLATVVSVLAQSPKPTISININAAQESYRSGDEIKLTVTLRNISHHKLYVDLSRPAREPLDARHSSGEVVPLTKFGRALRGQEELVDEKGATVIPLSSGNIVELDPGKAVIETLVLTKEYDFSRVGTYTLQIHRPDPDTKNLVIKSNIVTITVN